MRVTQDAGVLDETAPFLEGPPLAPDQDESYFEPKISDAQASLFEHCARAIEVSLGIGPHGLPLIGTGDWNDGLNRVGQEGRGESIWLGWFLLSTISEMAPLAAARGERARADRWREAAAAIQAAIEREGWDGDWYRRAFFDDGTPLGSGVNTECRIDSIAQSWSVISRAAQKGRARRAMTALDQYLVRRDDSLVLLLTPPFDQMPLDPGYIKGYLPGVRENGGQYTHAAIWSVIGFAMLGDGDRAAEMLGLLNPINDSSTRAAVHRYKVEPYVAVADVYSEHPHVGRGGWTWYTGSAGWMYRAAIEWILGVRREGAALRIDPCIPRGWRTYDVTVKHGGALYRIRVENPHGVSRGVARIEIDGRTAEGLEAPPSPAAAAGAVPAPAISMDEGPRQGELFAPAVASQGSTGPAAPGGAPPGVPASSDGPAASPATNRIGQAVSEAPEGQPRASGPLIPLVDDGKEHRVVIVLG